MVTLSQVMPTPGSYLLRLGPGAFQTERRNRTSRAVGRGSHLLNQ